MTVAEKLKPCRVCGRATSGVQCAHHAQPVRVVGGYESKRKSPSKRGYNYKWQQFRARYLKANPWCCDCAAKEKWVSAREVHHVEKLADRPDLKYTLTNLMGLCATCHAARSRRGE